MILVKTLFFKNTRARKLLLRNFALFTILAILPVMVVNLWFYKYTEDILNNEMTSINLEALYRARDICDSIMHEMEMLAVNTSLQEAVEAYVTSDNSDHNINAIQNYIKQYVRISEYVDNIYVYSQSTGYVISVNNYSPAEQYDSTKWLTAAKEIKNKQVGIKAYIRGDIYPYILSFLKTVKIGDTFGVVAVNINLENMGIVFKGVENKSTQSIYIFDGDNMNIYSDKISNTFGKKSEEFSQFKAALVNSNEYSAKADIDGKACLVSSAKSKYYNLTYLGVTPLALYNTKAVELFRIALVILLISLFIGFIIALFISIRTTDPINRIMYAIDEPNIGEGEEQHHIPEEIKYIINSIKRVQKDKTQLETELNSRLFLLKQSQAALLSAQINPHFLYNTLDTINWMAFSKLGKNNDISNSLSCLADLFRLGLEINGYLIPIEQELEHAKLYCTLLEARYNGKVKIVFNVPPQVRKLSIIRFCLQPLIENAAYHGIEPKRKNGTIEINIFTLEDYLIIEVSDDGIGLDEKYILELNMIFEKGLNDIEEDIRTLVKSWRNEIASNVEGVNIKNWYEGKKTGTSVGLSNVNRRIMLIFGEEYGIKISNNNKGGLTVTLRLPKK